MIKYKDFRQKYLKHLLETLEYLYSLRNTEDEELKLF